MILDVGFFDDILLSEKKQGPPGTPSAWKTELGWGVMGHYVVPSALSTTSVSMIAVAQVENQHLNKTLEKFWLMEELPKGSPIFSTEDLAVQEHFLATHYFSKSAGRYVVTLPKKVTTLQLGESHRTALHRFIKNEQSLLRKGKWEEFQSVVQEYLSLGHAQEVTPEELCTPVPLTYHLPMHAVYKQSSSSTKVRVVFDGSCPTSTGASLNDILVAGPTLYPNLDQILIKFRSYRVAVSADITKMYREVALCQSDRQLHRFLWRAVPTEPVRTYCMNRVTFGVTSSPYVSVRALQQAANDFSTPGSTLTNHIQKSFYVDDLLAGADDIPSAISLYQGLRELLLKAGFSLKKWRSSSTEVLQQIPKDLQEILPNQELKDNHTAAYPKTLGITWNSQQDVMAVQVQLPKEYISTKRGIVSDTARSFDVLGWLAPFLLKMKILFQGLWQKKVEWDQPLDEELSLEHQQWREQLSVLKTVTIPRCYFQSGIITSISLHGFSDASVAAYASVVYIRATYQDREPTSRLVVAKSKVAPLKSVSIPRLELCAAEMVAELLAITSNTLNIPTENLHGWCDSTVALAWLRGSPSRYKTFVANRVASAARNLPQSAWLHVPTHDNPADCASRGISAAELRDHNLWWEGPPWLKEDPVATPPQPGTEEIDSHQNTEAKATAIYSVSAVADTGWQCSFKAYSRLLHTTAYILRFFGNLRAAVKGDQLVKGQVLFPSEVRAVELLLFQNSQARTFGEEIRRVSAANPLPMKKNSALRLVHPYMSGEGLLLVGGRLEKANLPILQKNPVILSSRDAVTKLFFRHYHETMSHCGATLLLAHIGQEIYVPGAKRLAREVCQGCLLCKRLSPKTYQQKMGQLPYPRVNPSLCFVHTGLDYAGPFWIKTGHPRRPVRVKGYLAVFVCLATKATHLEAVSSKSTPAFIATLKRFISRRNVPGHIYSDNGSNFIGARNELKELFDFLSLESTQHSIKEELLAKRIEWHFIPDRAPHFGGIWEAAVKAAKHCLKGAVGKTMLSFEEITTVFCQAESCMNSRPYNAMDSLDPAGEMPLTSGHFLTGRPLGSYPEEPEEPNLTLTNRWRLCTAMVQSFWTLWQRSYLQTLQKSQKWHQEQPNVKVGDLVMLLEESELQNHWRIGKVLSVSPGSDGLVRTAQVLIKAAQIPEYPRNTTRLVDPVKVPIKTSILKRPVVKLAPLLAASPPQIF